MSFVMSAAITMNSQLDPKVMFKNAMPTSALHASPVHCISHATKYPKGVFQSNGNLFDIDTHREKDRERQMRETRV